MEERTPENGDGRQETEERKKGNRRRETADEKDRPTYGLIFQILSEKGRYSGSAADPYQGSSS